MVGASCDGSNKKSTRAVFLAFGLACIETEALVLDGRPNKRHFQSIDSHIEQQQSGPERLMFMPKTSVPPLKDLLKQAQSPVRRDVDLDGYSIELHNRKSDTLVVTFPSAAPHREPLARDNNTWGRDFIAKRGYAALHVKTNLNCWFRRPQLLDTFKALHDQGVFDGYRRVVTYGGSMGGYGALAYGGVCGATHVISLNPQVRLGPTVRDWETRFRAADAQDWSSTHLDVNESIARAAHVITVHDPRHEGDSKHVALLSHPSMTNLHMPFVGHRIPVHLQQLGQLAWLFDAAVDDQLVVGEFYRRIRHRRSLRAWREEMLEHASKNHRRKSALTDHFSNVLQDAGEDKSD